MAFRQAILVIHGMGEQRPLGTLREAVEAIVAPFDEAHRRWYSRPTSVTDSYEARRFIIPRVDTAEDPGRRQQTEVFEYHWAHLMTGNRLDDLTGTVRRILFQRYTRVPKGIRGLWLLLWGLIIFTGWAIIWGPLAPLRQDLTGGIEGGRMEGALTAGANTLAVIFGSSIVGSLAGWILTRLAPTWLTGSFVDVVRYLDTSPRSLKVRSSIREGAVGILEELNKRYDRVIVVGHSLGSYIAYDAIRYLWGRTALSFDLPKDPDERKALPTFPDGLLALEKAAVPLMTPAASASAEQVDDYRDAQRMLQRGMEAMQHRWKVTDLVSMGSPMYMADLIYTRSREEFDGAVARHEFPVCPPEEDHPPLRGEMPTEGRDKGHAMNYSYSWGGRRVLSDGAPFAPTRWTNLWFPTRFKLFGDWFGGALAPLFGTGIRDVPITSGSTQRLWPGLAHTRYYKVIAAEPEGPLATAFHEAVDLQFAEESEVNLTETDVPPAGATTAGSTI